MNKKYPIKPSKGFVEELLERAKRHGWNRDYTEIIKFVEDMYDMADIQMNWDDLEPYEDTEY